MTEFFVYSNFFSVYTFPMNVEWDENKNQQNKQKHHISFETASYVFADPFRLERYDHSENNVREEDSFQTIGKSKMFYSLFIQKDLNHIELFRHG